MKVAAFCARRNVHIAEYACYAEGNKATICMIDAVPELGRGVKFRFVLVCRTLILFLNTLFTILMKNSICGEIWVEILQNRFLMGSLIYSDRNKIIVRQSKKVAPTFELGKRL